MTADQEPRRDWICMSLLVGALAGIAFGCARIIALVGAKDPITPSVYFYFILWPVCGALVGAAAGVLDNYFRPRV
jgi:hypothetical protein